MNKKTSITGLVGMLLILGGFIFEFCFFFGFTGSDNLLYGSMAISGLTIFVGALMRNRAYYQKSNVVSVTQPDRKFSLISRILFIVTAIEFVYYLFLVAYLLLGAGDGFKFWNWLSIGLVSMFVVTFVVLCWYYIAGFVKQPSVIFTRVAFVISVCCLIFSLITGIKSGFGLISICIMSPYIGLVAMSLKQVVPSKS